MCACACACVHVCACMHMCICVCVHVRAHLFMVNLSWQIHQLSSSIFFLDPDECVDPTLNDCDENAICSNIQLSFTCVCREGFTDAGHPGGAGRKCIKDDNSTKEIEQRLARVEREFVEKKEFESQGEVIGSLKSESLMLKATAADWAAVSIAAITMVSLLFVALFIVYVYLYMVRAKSHRQVGTFYGHALKRESRTTFGKKDLSLCWWRKLMLLSCWCFNFRWRNSSENNVFVKEFWWE